MKQQKSPYEGNKRIMDDEATHEDKKTVALINLIVDIVVDATLAQSQQEPAPKVTPSSPPTKSDR
jgi:hypothetical protein